MSAAGRRRHASRGAEHYAEQLRRSSFDWDGIRGLAADYLVALPEATQIGSLTRDTITSALFDDFAAPWSVCRPPRPALNGTVTATVAMIVMEPALGVMEVAPLPALNRRFTTYRLEIARGAAAAVAG